VVLTDGDRVRNLLGRYCDLMDAGAFDAVGDLFASGSLVDDRGRVLARGAADVAAYYEKITRRYEGGGLRTKHLVVNTVLEEVPAGSDGADGAAPSIVARSSYVVLQAVDELPLQPIITGRYLDTFVSDGGSWRFEERAFLVDQLGDLSRHLRFDLA
jgi:hypothetical protein